MNLLFLTPTIDSAKTHFGLATSALQEQSPQFMLAQANDSIFSRIAPLLLIFLVFYLLVIRPKNKKMQLDNWKKNAIIKGDKILTSSGMLGKVVGFRDEGKTLVVEVSKDVKVDLLRVMVFDVFIELDKNGNRVDGKAVTEVVPSKSIKNVKSVGPKK